MSTRRPNIICIVTDQQRYDSLGCHGNALARTPHLDQLAGQSLVFDRCMTAHAVCMPSRATIMTGQYPSGHGVWSNGVPLPRREYTRFDPSEHMLKPDHPARGIVPSHARTFADHLGQHGYATASIGKLHLTPTQVPADTGSPESTALWNDKPDTMAAWHGPYIGFEHVDLSLGHGERCAGHFGDWLIREHPEADAARKHAAAHADRPVGRKDVYRGGLTVETHPTTWIADRACDYIRNHHADKPYMMWVGIPDPHHPFTPPASLAQMFEDVDVPDVCATDADGKPSAYRLITQGPGSMHIDPSAVRLIRQYTAAMVHLIDQAIGRIVQTLQETGQWEDTVIVFTSDHGDFLGDFGLLYKFPVADRTLNHVPLLVRLPGRGHDRIAHPASLADLAPTFCELAGAPPMITHGQSLIELAKDGRDPKRPVLTQHYGHGDDHSQINFTLWEQRYRYTWYPQTDERELYDHHDDPCELRNLASNPTHKQRVSDLHAALLDAHVRCDHRTTARTALW